MSTLISIQNARTYSNDHVSFDFALGILGISVYLYKGLSNRACRQYMEKGALILNYPIYFFIPVGYPFGNGAKRVRGSRLDTVLYCLLRQHT